MTESSALKILFAEDDPATRVLGKINLAKLGLNVDVACDGQEALRMWRSGGYKAILLDFNMPGLNGLEAARAIREEEAEKGSPRSVIILLTAKPMEQIEVLKTRGIVDSLIPKPVNYNEICQMLEDITPVGGEAPESGGSGPAKADEKPPIDLDELARNVGEDSLWEMADLFITQAGKYIQEIEEALANNDGDSISKAAHKLKGSSAQYTAHALVAPSEYLQDNCGESVPQGAAEKVGILKRGLEQIIIHVNETKAG